MKRGVQEKGGGSGPPDPPSGHAYDPIKYDVTLYIRSEFSGS